PPRPIYTLSLHDALPIFLRIGVDRDSRHLDFSDGHDVTLVWQERERHAEDVHVLWLEQPAFSVDFVVCAPQSAPDDLLAKQLRRSEEHTSELQSPDHLVC